MASDAAGNSSVSLAAHVGVPLAQIADTSTSRKKNMFNGNHSSIDTVVFGKDFDDSAGADKRDFTGAAGNLSSTADHMGLFAEGQSAYETANKAFALKSTADSLIFNRDIDGMDEIEDPRDFEGAAGNRSSSADFAVSPTLALTPNPSPGSRPAPWPENGPWP